MGHCERSFIFLAKSKFAKNYEAASTDLKSSKTHNVLNFGYILGILERLIPLKYYQDDSKPVEVIKDNSWAWNGDDSSGLRVSLKANY